MRQKLSWKTQKRRCGIPSSDQRMDGEEQLSDVAETCNGNPAFARLACLGQKLSVKTDRGTKDNLHGMSQEARSSSSTRCSIAQTSPSISWSEADS